MTRRRWIVALVVVVLAGTAWLATRRPSRVVAVPSPADSLSTGLKAARLFFATVDGDSLVIETREQIETQNFHDRVATLIEELELGPRGRGLKTLPAGTSVQHAYLDERGLLTLDLSRAFRDGFRGGSVAEYLTVASLTRTLTANVPEVKRVMLVCAGQPITTLAGHLPLDRAIDAAEWP